MKLAAQLGKCGGFLLSLLLCFLLLIFSFFLFLSFHSYLSRYNVSTTACLHALCNKLLILIYIYITTCVITVGDFFICSSSRGFWAGAIGMASKAFCLNSILEANVEDDPIETKGSWKVVVLDMTVNLCNRAQ